MMPSRIFSLLLAAPVIAGAAGAQNQVAAKTQPAASQVVCPLTELQWGIGQSLPDPWWSEPKKTTDPFNWAALIGSSFGPYTVSATGKEMLACRWADHGKTSYGAWPLPIQIGAPPPPNTHIYMMRPATNTPPETWTCPATVQVRVLSPLPPPWLGTTYQWNRTGKELSVAAGVPVNMCQYSGMIPNQILYPIQTTAQAGMTGLVSNPPPAIDQLAQAFLVTKAQLTAIPAKRSTSCPTTVRFQGRIGANAAGTVSYRTEINGETSAVKTVSFTAPGEKAVNFETQVAPALQQAGNLTLTTQAQSSNVVNGLARIVIQSPGGVPASNVASYQITCTPLAPAGNLTQAAPVAPEPAPAQVAAPTSTANPPRPGQQRFADVPPANPSYAASRGAIRTRQVPMRLADGRSGSVEFNITVAGGRPTGRVVQTLGRPPAQTVYQVSGGSVRRSAQGWEVLLQFSTTDRNVGARPIAGRLLLTGIEHEDTWRVQEMSDGDVWVIGGLTCQKSGNELVCT